MELKKWQKEAIQAEKTNERLVVSTPRVSGKTQLLIQLIINKAKEGQRNFHLGTRTFDRFKVLVQMIEKQLTIMRFNIKDFHFCKGNIKNDSKLYCDEVIPKHDSFFTVITKPYVELSYDIDQVTEEVPHIGFSQLLKLKACMPETEFQEDVIGKPK